jgi:hypothetical protein
MLAENLKDWLGWPGTISEVYFHLRSCEQWTLVLKYRVWSWLLYWSSRVGKCYLGINPQGLRIRIRNNQPSPGLSTGVKSGWIWSVPSPKIALCICKQTTFPLLANYGPNQVSQISRAVLSLEPARNATTLARVWARVMDNVSTFIFVMNIDLL